MILFGSVDKISSSSGEIFVEKNSGCNFGTDDRYLHDSICGMHGNNEKSLMSTGFKL